MKATLTQKQYARKLNDAAFALVKELLGKHPDNRTFLKAERVREILATRHDVKEA